MNGPISVLVVESDPKAAEIKKQALANGPLPLEIEVKARLDDAVKFLEYRPPDVMLVEVADEMPECAVLQLIQHLHSRHMRTALVVIGADDDELAVRLCGEGAQDFVYKSEVGNGVLARAVAVAASRQQRKATDVFQKGGFDESMTSRVNLDKLASMSMDMDEGASGVQ